MNLDGTTYAMTSTCTHAGCRLQEGKFVGGERRELQCPCHGSVFSLSTGTPLHGPATADEVGLDTRVADGTIEVRPRQR